ncbi:MAG TPA: glutathione S-transferase family protein [Polyangiaceae bacterium]|nr:glutathione S-transferase family protein [Polyangiaceae bacterium]
MMKLHHHPLSTFSRRVRIALLEKDIAVELVEVDMPGRAHKREPYLSLNPYGRVPTLVDDDLVLYESTAILEYLEAKVPAKPLLPHDVRQRALVAMHMKLCDLQMTRPAGTVIFPKRFMPEASWRRDEMAKASAEVERHFAILDHQLAGRPYLVGDRYTLADLCYVPFLDFMHLFDVTVPPQVRSWADGILARPTSVATRLAH